MSILGEAIGGKETFETAKRGEKIADKKLALEFFRKELQWQQKLCDSANYARLYGK